MAERSGEERTEEPTQRRLEEAQRKGQVPQSRELNTAVVLIAGVALLAATGPALCRSMREGMAQGIANTALAGRAEYAPVSRLREAGMEAGRAALPFLAGLVLLSGASAFLQTGGTLSAEKVQPKFDRVNPVSGFGRLFSLRRLVMLGAIVAKLVVVASAVGTVLYVRGALIGGLAGLPAVASAAATWRLTLEVAGAAALGMLVLALADYAYQRWQHHRDMMMTHAEIKEDRKMSEGDPHVKARVRAAQRQAATRRMMQEVPKADVVVTNPTHLAVAIRYDNATMSAPTVTAKGADWLAQRIVSLARRHSVPIVQRKPLARLLYRTVEVGQGVPAKLYYAVAEVLAYVYRLRGHTL